MRKVLFDSSMTIKSGATRTVDKKAYQTKTDLPMDLPLVNVLFSYEVLHWSSGGRPACQRKARARAVIVATLRRFCDR